jgi:hypothetical protein
MSGREEQEPGRTVVRVDARRPDQAGGAPAIRIVLAADLHHLADVPAPQEGTKKKKKKKSAKEKQKKTS